MYIITENLQCFDCDVINIGDVFEITIASTMKKNVILEKAKYSIKCLELQADESYLVKDIDVNSIENIVRVYENA